MLSFEVKHIVRGLLRTPWFTGSAALMLGMGLGLVLAGFAIVQSFVLKPPPFPQADQIVHFELENTVTNDRNNNMPIHTWAALRDAQSQMAYFAAFGEGTINVGATGNGEDQRAERYDGVFASADLFRALGVEPLLGRNFQTTDAHDGAARVSILSHAMWQHRFLGDPSVIGQDITINGEPATVIGVMQEGFRFPRNQSIWVNFSTDIHNVPRGSGRTVEGLGRLLPGASIAGVQNELQSVISDEHRLFPESSHGDYLAVKTVAREYVNDITRGILRAMFMAVSIVLLIACANVAGLLGARASQRSREQSIRGALGASRARLLLTGLVEAGFISGLATVIGIVIAQGFVNWFQRVLRSSEDGPPMWVSDISFDFSVFLFAVGVAFMATLVSGWLPSWRASGVAAGTALRSGGQGSIGAGLGRVGRYLVAFEIALSLMLLVSAGLVIRSVLNMQHIDIGANVSQVMSGRIGLFEEAYPEQTQVQQFLRQAQSDLQALPEAQNATVATSLPMTFGGRSLIANEALQDVEPDQLPAAEEVIIADNYFEFFDIQMLAGRAFNSGDNVEGAPVVVISRGLAMLLWGDDSLVNDAQVANRALGQQLRVRDFDEQWHYRTVVGVVGEVVNDGEDLAFGSGRPISGAYYLPLDQGQARFWSLAVKSRSNDPHILSDGIRSVIQNLDNDLPTYWLRSIGDWIDQALFDHRLIAKLFAAFGIIALLLTAVGLYALLAYAVARQTREIGVRRALGASAIRIVRNVSHAGLVQLVLGSIAGLGLAMLFARLLANILYDISPFDPLTFISVLVLLAIVTVIASALPAMRATRIQPMEALRYE